ncbi:MAG TPA: hypothetical protein VFR55_10035 [Dehalococcoidia bacterium]|nr:hypothetical protein [Dehalococcoidia bacterium]
MAHRKPIRLFTSGVLGVFSLFVLAACGNAISQEEVDAKDRQIADLQAQITQLQGEVSGSQRDSRFWQQLTSLMEPVAMPSMSDHRAFMLPDSGTVIALHLDNLGLQQAENLNWVALGVPGVFCKRDQERVEAQFGPGFTHFHDMANDTHGGAPGAEGVWFVHTAVRDFESPMSGGAVSQGVDYNFMPTVASDCG